MCFQNYVFDSASGELISNPASDGEYHFNLGNGGFSIFNCLECDKGMFVMEIYPMDEKTETVELAIGAGPMAGKTVVMPDFEKLRARSDEHEPLNPSDIQEVLSNSKPIEP